MEICCSETLRNQIPVRLIANLHIDLRWHHDGLSRAAGFSEYYRPAELYAELVGRAPSSRDDIRYLKID